MSNEARKDVNKPPDGSKFELAYDKVGYAILGLFDRVFWTAAAIVAAAGAIFTLGGLLGLLILGWRQLLPLLESLASTWPRKS